MRSILGARKVYHAIDAGESGTSTAASVRVKLLLGQNVTTALWKCSKILVRGYRNQEHDWVVWGRREDKETNRFVATGKKGGRTARNRRPLETQCTREDQPDQEGRGVREGIEGWCLKKMLGWW